MKTLQNSPKPVIVMFWSVPTCSMLRAYKEKCYLLNQAINQTKPVEIVTKNDKILRLKNIGIKSGKFFGIEDFTGKINKTLININNIKMVTIL